MAIITEEPDHRGEPKKPAKKSAKQPKQPAKQPAKEAKPKSAPPPQASTNALAFWFYFILCVSLITVFFSSMPSLSPDDPKTWFLSLPTSLRQHYSKGRTIKVQTHPNQPPIEVFSIDNGHSSAENVFLVHGLGLSSYSFREVVRSLGSKGVRAVAVDLPGNGFSDKYTVEEVEGPTGVMARFWNVYSEIMEKGVFSAFDQIVETGQIPYQDVTQFQGLKRKTLKMLDLGPEEIGKVLGQVIGTMGLAPVHLVLHDSALGLAANWVVENSGSVRSITLIDTPEKVAGSLPLGVLGTPVLREVVMGYSFVFARLLSLCCSRGMSDTDAEAHRVLLKGRDGRRAVVGIGKKMNYSFDLSEWGGSDGLKDMPMQVLWSSGWSKEWSEEGKQVADALPQANFVAHSGGRWPQEDAPEELAGNIVRFISSLPKTIRQVEEEPIPEHIQKRLDEAKNSDHQHHSHGNHDGHGHDHGAGYMDAYGLGGGWGLDLISSRFHGNSANFQYSQ